MEGQDEVKVPMDIGEEIEIADLGWMYRDEGGYTVHDDEGREICRLKDSEYDDGEAMRAAYLVLRVAHEVAEAAYVRGLNVGREDEREKITYGFQACFPGLCK